MGAGHDHGTGAAAAQSASSKHLWRLAAALGLGLCAFVIQVTVGFATSSLALLSDSAHVLTDVLGVAMSLTAVLLSRRTSSAPAHTFGLYRSEVFAALLNALLLVGVAAWILYEAIQRIADPPEVPGLPVVVVAVIGLLLNIGSFALLRAGARESLNVRGAYLEVLADMVGSFGVLISGLLTWTLGWRYADPLIGVAIGLFVLPRAFSLGRQAVRILFQHAPAGIDITAVNKQLSGLDGVVQAHDVHVWTLTSGMDVASAHLTVSQGVDRDDVLQTAQAQLRAEFGIEHATLQVEQTDSACHEMRW